MDLTSIEKVIHNLKTNKASHSSDIPTKIMKENVDLRAFYQLYLNVLKNASLVRCLLSEILFGVPQGSIFVPLSFNIFLADLFFILKKIDIANYADDNTPYTSSIDVNGLIKSLKASKELLTWFDDNLMKSNPDKCHLLVSTMFKSG